MKVQVYKSVNARTDAQTEAMRLKKNGHKVTKLLDEQGNLVAFGYNEPNDKTYSHYLENIKEGDYDFIYWN